MTRALPVWWALPDHGREIVADEPAAGTEVLSVRSPAQLTAANRESFGRQVGAALNGHQSIELDLAHTTFMDCAGLNGLIALNQLARGRRGVLRVVNPTPSVRQLFAIVDAGRLFEVVPPAGDQGHLSREPAHGSGPDLEAQVGGRPHGAVAISPSILGS